MKGLLFTYVMTYGGAVASLINPFYGLLIYICFAIVKPESLWWWSVPSGNYSRVVGIALLAGWMLHGFGRWNLGRSRLVISALVGFFVWAVLSASRAPDQPRAWGFVEQCAKLLLPILVGITTIESVRQLKCVAWVILLSQAYPAFELNLTYLGGYNQLKEEGFSGMDNNCYAIALVTSTGLAFFLFLHSEKWWQKGIAAFSAAVMGHAILFSFSRGGMLGLIAMGVTILAIMPKSPKQIGIFALTIVAVSWLAGPEVRARFATSFANKEERDASAESRLELWSACWDTMLKNPLLGVGPDHMPLHMEEFGFKRGKEAHTLWLQIGAELGFAGMLLLVSYYGLCILYLLPLATGRVEASDPWFNYLARMVVASLCGFVVSGQFVSLEFLESPYYVAMLGAGVLKLSTISRPMSPDLNLVG